MRFNWAIWGKAAESNMGRVHQWVRSDRVGSGDIPSIFWWMNRVAPGQNIWSTVNGINYK